MKKKQVKIDRLIIISSKNTFSVIEDFLKKGWKKIDENTYNFINYFIKIEIINNKTIIDIWEKDKLTGYVTSGKISFLRFLSIAQIKLWIRSWIKKIKVIDPNCKISLTYTTIEGKPVLINIILFLIITPILLLTISLLIAILIVIIRGG